MIQIIVDSEKLKQTILRESEEIHDTLVCEGIDINVNTLNHIYCNPDLIIVKTAEGAT